MSAAPKKTEPRSILALRVLVDQHEGLPLGRIAKLAGEDVIGPSRHRIATNYASTLNRMEKHGYVQRLGKRPAITWLITQQGREMLASGTLRPPSRGFTHGTNYGYNKAHCRCDECRAWFHGYFQKWYPGSNMQQGAAEYSRKWRTENPERNKARQDRGKKQAQKKNAESRDGASRHNKHWTGPEMEILSREDLTTVQAAAMLGRTLRSVQTMRWYLKDGNPRDRMLRDGPPPTSRSGPR